MRKWLIVIVAVLQLLVLAGMAAQREWVVSTGRTVYLRTAPIDPRDVFRGDYVRLGYEISTIPIGLLGKGVERSDLKRADVVYALLDLDEANRGRLRGASITRPQSGAFIRGRIAQVWERTVRVRYGLEAYFVEQGRGLDLERLRSRDGVQVPMEMEIALGRNGLAVLKGHRWTRLGIGVRIEREAPAGRPRGRSRAVSATLRLMNASDKPLAIVVLPEGRSFSLEPTAECRHKWKWAMADKPPPVAQDAHVHVLEPDEIHESTIDLTDRSWWVVDKDGKAHQVGDLTWQDRFRLVYRSPSADQCSRLAQADVVWRGDLPSQAFRGGWLVD